MLCNIAHAMSQALGLGATLKLFRHFSWLKFTSLCPLVLGMCSSTYITYCIALIGCRSIQLSAEFVGVFFQFRVKTKGLSQNQECKERICVLGEMLLLVVFGRMNSQRDEHTERC